MEKWPNFFIVGTTKSGTTSLHEYLNRIPGIFMSPIKEPHYFSKNDISRSNPILHIIKDTNKYLSLFDGVEDEKIIGESSASYLTSVQAPILIHQQMPNAKILISLRDPVERAFSAYLDHRRYGRITDSLDQELKIQLSDTSVGKKSKLPLQNGLYFDNVNRYQKIFGSNQVKIIIFEEWIKNIKSTLQEILDFLNIEYIMDTFESDIYNPYASPRGSVAKRIMRSKIVNKISNEFFSPKLKKSFLSFLLKKSPKPKMSDESRKILTNFYKEDVEKLKILLNRNLPWQNFTS